MKALKRPINTCYIKIISCLLLVVACLLLPIEARANGLAPKQETILLSWSEDPMTTQTIIWRNDSSVQSGVVQYMPKNNYNGDFNEASEVEATVTELYEGCNHFEAVLRDLIPNTSYAYRVGSQAGWSDADTFTTGGVMDSFSFVYMGDVQGTNKEEYDAWGDMIQNLYRDNEHLKFALMGGDLIDGYMNINQWEQFWDNAGRIFGSIPMMSVRGNHDDSYLYPDTLAFPQNGPEGLLESCYSFDYGSAHFVIIDSNVFSKPELRERQNQWLKDDLAATDKDWKLVAFHAPIYGTFSNTGHSKFAKSFIKILEEGGVDVVFTAHEHEYMRSKPIKCNEESEDGYDIVENGYGIVYLMGNSGSKFYPPGPGYHYIEVEIPYTSNCQLINIDENHFELTTQNDKGETIDKYSFEKRTQYPITTTVTDDGVVVPSRKKAPQGDTVNLAITPDVGKRLVEGSLKYTTDGGASYVPIQGDSFTMPARDVTITCEFERNSHDYTVNPQEDETVYTIGETADGIKTMAVNNGVSGMKCFGVQITSGGAVHEGDETAVFTHIRDGKQLSINTTVADFDIVDAAAAGFNVETGDIIKAYLVDELTNDDSKNPVVLSK